MMDWTKAGVRLRRTPHATGAANPDWNYPAQRWKDEADYAGEELTADEVRWLTGCPMCKADPGDNCRTARGDDMEDDFCTSRRRAAGEVKVAQDGSS